MRLLRLALLAAFLAVPALAAPAPVEPGEDDGWLRAMPDDCDLALVFDAKAFYASPLVKKGLKDKLPALLSERFLVPVPLKALGVDPVADLRQVAFVMGRSMWTDKDGKPESSGAMLVLMRTGKSEASLKSKLAELAKDGTKGVRALPEGNVYETSDGGARAVMAVLPGGVLAVGEKARPVADALARLKTVRKPSFKHAEMAKFMKALKPGPVLRMAMLPEAVVNSHFTRRDNGGGQVVTESRLVTLGEQGYAGVRVEATVKETIKGKGELECKDAATAEKKAKEIEGVLALVLPQMEEQAKAQPGLGAVLRVVKTAKITSQGRSVFIEAEIDPEAVEALKLAGPKR